MFVDFLVRIFQIVIETCNTREEAEEVLNELLANNDSDEKFGIYTDEGWEATIY